MTDKQIYEAAIARGREVVRVIVNHGRPELLPIGVSTKNGPYDVVWAEDGKVTTMKRYHVEVLCCSGIPHEVVAS